jgi:hypothetical protein
MDTSLDLNSMSVFGSLYLSDQEIKNGLVIPDALRIHNWSALLKLPNHLEIRHWNKELFETQINPHLSFKQCVGDFFIRHLKKPNSDWYIAEICHAICTIPGEVNYCEHELVVDIRFELTKNKLDQLLNLISLENAKTPKLLW